MANSVILRERSRSPVLPRENPQSTIDRLLRELAAKDAEIEALTQSRDIKQSIMDALTGATMAQQETIKTLQARVDEKELRIATLEGKLKVAICDFEDMVRMVHDHCKAAKHPDIVNGLIKKASP